MYLRLHTIRVAPDGNRTFFIHAGDNTATNPAIGTGGAHILTGFWQLEHGSSSLGNSSMGLLRPGNVQLNKPGIGNSDGESLGRALVRALREACFERNHPIVQRTGHAVAVNNPTAERAFLVWAGVLKLSFSRIRDGMRLKFVCSC